VSDPLAPRADAIYHITSQLEWEHARGTGTYQADSLLSEGFIHCCLARQVESVGRRHFAGRSDLVVLGIDPARLKWEVRFEPGEGGELYPHLYGPLPVAAVISVHSFST
jgi:uncharacterized protein (DUF952 family)